MIAGQDSFSETTRVLVITWDTSSSQNDLAHYTKGRPWHICRICPSSPPSLLWTIKNLCNRIWNSWQSLGYSAFVGNGPGDAFLVSCGPTASSWCPQKSWIGHQVGSDSAQSQQKLCREGLGKASSWRGWCWSGSKVRESKRQWCATSYIFTTGRWVLRSPLFQRSSQEQAFMTWCLGPPGVFQAQVKASDENLDLIFSEQVLLSKWIIENKLMSFTPTFPAPFGNTGIYSDNSNLATIPPCCLLYAIP